jgi:serine/threonine protein kinase
MNKTSLGTPLYMAPEVMEGFSYDNKCDLWSVGVCFYEILFGKFPYMGNSIPEILRNIKACNGDRIEFPMHLNSISQECQDLLRAILVEDPKERISWQDFFTHSLFAEHGRTDNRGKQGGMINGHLANTARILMKFQTVAEQNSQAYHECPMCMDDPLAPARKPRIATVQEEQCQSHEFTQMQQKNDL